jgi:hypothetical protein
VCQEDEGRRRRRKKARGAFGEDGELSREAGHVSLTIFHAANFHLILLCFMEPASPSYKSRPAAAGN